MTQHHGAMAKQGPATPGKPTPSAAATPSLPMRVGGAFVALALVLLIFALIGAVNDGLNAAFPVTVRVVTIWAAAAIIGAFAVTSTSQRATRGQVIALGVAIALIIVGRFVPEAVLFWTTQTWLVLYACVALVCSLVLRRRAVSV